MKPLGRSSCRSRTARRQHPIWAGVGAGFGAALLLFSASSAESGSGSQAISRRHLLRRSCTPVADQSIFESVHHAARVRNSPTDPTAAHSLRCSENIEIAVQSGENGPNRESRADPFARGAAGNARPTTARLAIA